MIAPPPVCDSVVSTRFPLVATAIVPLVVFVKLADGIVLVEPTSEIPVAALAVSAVVKLTFPVSPALVIVPSAAAKLPVPAVIVPTVCSTLCPASRFTVPFVVLVTLAAMVRSSPPPDSSSFPPAA